jgi:hypothetical protein
MQSEARIFGALRRSRSTLIGVLMTAALVTAGAVDVCAQSDPSATALGSLGVSAPAPQAAFGFEAASQSESLAPGPSYCSPCLYYSGDLNTSDPNANGLSDENTPGDSLSQVFTAFKIPSGHMWAITAVLANVQAVSGSVHLPKKAGWSVWRRTSSGQPGTLLAAGASPAAFSPTGRNLLGFLPEYTAKITLANPVNLPAGTYFLNVMPQCTDPTSCSSQRFYESNVTDVSPVHHHGPTNILDDSFFNSNKFGADYVNANTEPGVFDLFSFGIIGTCTTTGGLTCPF